jgi:hypothetical protein
LQEASKLALQAVSFQKLEPILKGLIPQFAQLTQKAKAVIDPSLALGESSSTSVESLLGNRSKVSAVS